jgi:hypothetical protein
MPGPARQLHTQQVHYLRKRVLQRQRHRHRRQFWDTSGGLPDLIGIHARITTAFNAATTNNLLIGTAAGGNDIMVTGESLAAQRASSPATIGQAVTFANDTDLYVAYAQTGGAATAGDGYVV